MGLAATGKVFCDTGTAAVVGPTGAAHHSSSTVGVLAGFWRAGSRIDTSQIIGALFVWTWAFRCGFLHGCRGQNRRHRYRRAAVPTDAPCANAHALVCTAVLALEAMEG